jgi:Domain of unknown function (DUF4390)
MTRRHILVAWLLAAMAPVAPVAVVVAHAGPDLSVTPSARDGQVLVSFELNDGFTAEVRDAIRSGLATTFLYAIELRRGAATWFDKTIAEVTITTTVRFDNLTRRYQMSRTVDGRVEDARPTEDEEAMRRFMTRFAHIPLSMTSTLETNGDYYVRIRAHTRPHNSWFFWPWDRGSMLGHATFTFLP